MFEPLEPNRKEWRSLDLPMRRPVVSRQPLARSAEEWGCRCRGSAAAVRSVQSRTESVPPVRRARRAASAAGPWVRGPPEAFREDGGRALGLCRLKGPSNGDGADGSSAYRVIVLSLSRFV